jgi:hypothetical protein
MMDKVVEMQISVGFLDPHIFTSTNISRQSALLVQAMGKAMKNDYVVGAYNTSHWVTLIICMKFKDVWYLDSAKQHPTQKFTDVKLLWIGQ